MTPTEKGRRRDALLYGFDTRLQLCDMIANREADLEELREDNAKLRELLDYMTPIALYSASERDRMRELGVDDD